jgi:hypothetical protein
MKARGSVKARDGMKAHGADFPLPRSPGEGGRRPGEGVVSFGEKRRMNFAASPENDALSCPCRGTLPRRAGEGKASGGGSEVAGGDVKRLRGWALCVPGPERVSMVIATKDGVFSQWSEAA